MLHLAFDQGSMSVAKCRRRFAPCCGCQPGCFLEGLRVSNAKERERSRDVVDKRMERNRRNTYGDEQQVIKARMGPEAQGLLRRTPDLEELLVIPKNN